MTSSINATLYKYDQTTQIYTKEKDLKKGDSFSKSILLGTQAHALIVTSTSSDSFVFYYQNEGSTSSDFPVWAIIVLSVFGGLCFVFCFVCFIFCLTFGLQILAVRAGGAGFHRRQMAQASQMNNNMQPPVYMMQNQPYMGTPVYNNVPPPQMLPQLNVPIHTPTPAQMYPVNGVPVQPVYEMKG